MVWQIDGIQFVETALATVKAVDWSECRSIPRAKRRHAMGIKTRRRIVEKPTAYQMGGTIFMHPAIAAELRAQTRESAAAVRDFARATAAAASTAAAAERRRG